MNPTSRHRRHSRSRDRLSGTAQRPRVSIHRSTRRVVVQLIDDQTGQTLAAVHDSAPRGAPGKKLLPAKRTKSSQAKEAGLELARAAKLIGITRAVFDRSGYKYHGRVKAVAEGLRAGGLVI